MAGLAPTIPPTTPSVGGTTPLVQGGINYRDAYNADVAQAASGDYMPQMAQEFINQANTMVGNGSLPDAPMNLGAQAPGMNPATALLYANSQFRQGVTQSHTDHKRLLGRNLFPGHIVFGIRPPASETNGHVADHDHWNDALNTIERGPARGRSSYSQGAEINAFIKNIPVRGWNQADLNCELFRRQRTPLDSTGRLPVWETPEEFMKANRAYIHGAIDTSSNKNVIGSRLVSMSRQPGIKDCDIIPRGYAMTFRHSVYGHVGKQGYKFVCHLVQVPLTEPEQERMIKLTEEYMQSVGALHGTKSGHAVLDLPGRAKGKHDYATETSPYIASEKIAEARNKRKDKKPMGNGRMAPAEKDIVYVWQILGFCVPDADYADGLLLNKEGFKNCLTWVVGIPLSDFESQTNVPEFSDEGTKGKPPVFYSMARIQHHHHLATNFFGGQHTDYGSAEGKEVYVPGGDHFVHTLIDPSGMTPDLF